jgi:hypothetical protein
MTKGLWRWKMKNHVLIMGGPNINQEQFLFRLVTDLQESEEFVDREEWVSGCDLS